MTAPTPDQLAETVREALPPLAPEWTTADGFHYTAGSWPQQERTKKARRALTALLARCKEAERERDALQHTIDCANTPLMRDVLDAKLAAEKRIEELEAALFECYVWSGADTDGAKILADMGRINPPINVRAVEAVKELRRDYDADDGCEAAEAQLAACREALRDYVKHVNDHAEALADYTDDLDDDVQQIVSSLGFVARLDPGCLDPAEDNLAALLVEIRRALSESGGDVGP